MTTVLPLLDTARVRPLLQAFDFKTLFLEELGWDHHANRLPVMVDGQPFLLQAVAEKRGLAVYVCAPGAGGSIPDYATRRKIERQVAKSAYEHVIIYVDKAQTTQIWQWVKREAGRPAACREHAYHRDQAGDALVQKLQALVIGIEQEADLTLLDVTRGVRGAFDVERVTKRFYDLFKGEHTSFLAFLQGIPDTEMQQWYVSVMLNRLMFIYFIQKKGFLAGDRNYLRNKLQASQQRGKDRFYREFLGPLFFEGFARKDAERTPATRTLLGPVPYLNGGLFARHQIEERYGQAIQIPDAAFERLFAFFEQYQWHLDERPLHQDNEINPDVLGYIFEKYINQKQMGAYYTKEDITEYIARNTVIPFLFDAAAKECAIAFGPGGTVWRLLREEPDRYIYPAVRHGVERELPAEIAAGVADVSRRGGWNRPAGAEYALPTETWREVAARRQRYQEVRGKLATGEIGTINDLITYNLDIQRFAEDAIATCEGPELLRAFYQALVGRRAQGTAAARPGISILDPTCGSGAFLFAALNVLKPLYAACLDRMGVFLADYAQSRPGPGPRRFVDFEEIGQEVAKRPNRDYFILKTIIVNNLYGVDIMEEAVEIAKLRLFLKLVAQVEEAETIEPLPDIDFNIRAGNTLVGFATLAEAKAAIGRKFDFDNAGQRITEKAEDLDRLFTHFRAQQTTHGGSVTAADKAELRRQAGELEAELNRYLAQEYGVDPQNQAALAQWQHSHQPFHWFVEFYGLIEKHGGFDVIIGNPPYVEYSKVVDQYKVKGYHTEECGNLYAYVMERSLRLKAITGRCGMIVPMSGHSTDRMEPLVKSFYDKADLLHIINISADANPSVLFPGVKFRLAIFLHQGESKGKAATRIYSTRYLKWFADERIQLFELLRYTPVSLRPYGLIPKIADPLHESVLKKLTTQKGSLGLQTGRYLTYYNNTPVSWMRAHPFVPYFYSERDGEKASTQLKPIALATEAQALAASGIICSSLFYVWWLTSSDCYHLNKREVDGLPVNIANSHLVGSLAASSKELMTDLKAKSRRRVYVYKTSGRVEYDEFYPKLSKPIIDKIDQVLAQYYGFTNEELDFIINYDIKYRMGRDAEDEGDEGQPGADEADPAPPARSTERNGDKGPAVKAAAPAAAPAGTTPRAEDFGGAGPTQMPLEPGAQQLGLDAAATGPAWRVGARVRHAAFGEGQVVAVERAGAAQTVTVQFAGKRRKQFLARQAPLERV